jgi:hypothetical protein
MLLKILLIGTLVAASMAVVKDGRLLARAGLVGGCTQLSATAPDGGTWEACKRGRLEDYPDLSGKSCISFGVKRGREFWRCPAAVVSSQAPRA